MPAEHPWTPWHDRLHRTLLRSPELLPDGAPLLLAVSGGQDSMALLALLIDLSRLHHWNLMVWHGDHGWHARSAAIAAELQSWCEANSIPMHVERAEPEAVSNEASARNWRYDALERLAHQEQRDVVSGHTASDRAETLLLHLARGTDLKGLSSLRPARPLRQNAPEGPWLRRPLLSFSRAETLSICTELNVPIWLDPSNDDRSLARNCIRHDVVPVLEKLHPGSSLRMAGLAERLSHVRDIQAELAELVLQQLECDGVLQRRQIGAISSKTRRVLLALWLEQQGVPPLDAMQLEQLSGRLELGEPGGQSDLPGGWRLSWQGDALTLQPPAEEH